MSWPTVKLGELFDVGSSKRVLQVDWRSSGVPFYRAREVVKLAKQGHVDNELFIEESMYSAYASKYGVPQEGDIIVTAVGTLGVTYAVKKTDKFYFKDASVLWLRKKTEVDTRFIEYAFRTDLVQRHIQNAAGATVGTYTIEKAKNTLVPLPPLEEQKRIAAILDKADAIRKKRQQAIELADQFLKSVFLDMFGDPVTNPKGWEVKTGEDLFFDMKYGTSQKCSELRSPGSLPVMRIPNIANEEINLDDLKFAVLEARERDRLLLKSGDILFVRSNGNPDYIGRCAVVPKDMEALFASYLIRARVDPEVCLPEFLQHIVSCESYRASIVREARTTAGNFNISAAGLRNLSFICPPLDIQNEFIDLAKQIERGKTRCVEYLGASRKLFNAIESGVFMGGLVKPKAG